MAEKTKTLKKQFNLDDESQFVLFKTGKIPQVYTNGVTATGLLLFKKVDNDLKLLLISYDDVNWNKLDDLGGTIDEQDNTIFDAMLREVEEESNGEIMGDYAKSIIENSTNKCKFYTKKCKFVGTAIEVDKDLFNDCSIFGTFEKTDEIKRTINWYSFREVKNDMAIRLVGSNELMAFLEKQC